MILTQSDINNDLSAAMTERSIELDALQKQCEQKDKTIHHLRIENEHLLEKIRLLLHQKWGSKSEALSNLQIDAFDDIIDIDALVDDLEQQCPDLEQDIDIPPHKKRSKSPSVKLPSYLERRQHYIELPEDQRICPHSKKPMQIIGVEKSSEQLEHIPEQYYVVENYRYKYSCEENDGCIQLAPTPLSPVPKSIASASLMAKVIADKFIFHMPFYRIENDLNQRWGIGITRAQLAYWTIHVADLVQPIVNLMHEQLLEQTYIHGDETQIQVLKEQDRTAKNKSWVWIYYALCKTFKVVTYHYSPYRSGEVVQEHLAGYEGYLSCDGYSAYDTLGDKIILSGCWAHCRRYFYDTIKSLPKKHQSKGTSYQALRMIKALYIIERFADKHHYTIDQRLALRKRRSQPIIDKFRLWLTATIKTAPNSGSLGKALTYADNQWGKLIIFLNDGRIRLDNNVVEQQVKPFAVSRKNWLFAQSPEGARANANLFSIIQTAKLNDIEPRAYLQYLFEELPKIEREGNIDRYDELLPWRCANQLKTIYK